MKYPLSEILDRLSILILKQERLPDDEDITLQVTRFSIAAVEFSVAQETRQTWLNELIEVNGNIWDLEADIRAGRECRNFERIGMDAIAIRNLNAERVRLKNVIAEAMGEFKEVKVDHASEQTSDPPAAA